MLIDLYYWTAIAVVMIWAVASWYVTVPMIETLHRQRSMTQLPFVTSAFLLGAFNALEAVIYLYTIYMIRGDGFLPRWNWLLEHAGLSVLVFLGLRGFVSIAIQYLIRRKPQIVPQIVPVPEPLLEPLVVGESGDDEAEGIHETPAE